MVYLLMELILINQTKLKIMLSAPDMKHYELLPEKLEHMTCTDHETRVAFRHIFDDAEARTGFHTSGEKLLVQMFTSKCGGCEIFVTRLENDPLMYPCEQSLTPGEEDLIRRVLESEGDSDCDEIWEGVENDMMDPREDTAFSSSGKEKHSNVSYGLRRAVLTVDSLNILLAVCKRLTEVGYTGESRCYAEKDRISAKYHLYLEIPDGIFYQLPESYAFLKEYGVVDRSRHMELYLSEHGQLICDSKAVSTLGAL